MLLLFLYQSLDLCGHFKRRTWLGLEPSPFLKRINMPKKVKNVQHDTYMGETKKKKIQGTFCRRRRQSAACATGVSGAQRLRRTQTLGRSRGMPPGKMCKSRCKSVQSNTMDGFHATIYLWVWGHHYIYTWIWGHQYIFIWFASFPV